MFLHQAPLASAQQMQICFDKFEFIGHYTQGLAYFALDVEYLQTQKKHGWDKEKFYGA